MRIVADENIPRVADYFSQHGHITLLPGRDISRNDLVKADALLVRSITRCDRDLLLGTPVRFIGTATIGTDHLDETWLAENEMTWASAPGCNANAVAEYVISAVLTALLDRRAEPGTPSVGVIGYGNVGKAVARKFRALGWPVKACDPPLADAGETGLVSLEEALACEIVCLHTPLTKSGSHPTFNMIDETALSQLRDDVILLNAGRGGVIEETALKDWIKGQPHAALILDVWDGEPNIDPELVKQCRLATPHIAGHSIDGKLAGTRMIYEAFCEAFEFSQKPPACREETLRSMPWPGRPDYWSNVLALLQRACPVVKDHALLMKLVEESIVLGSGFDRLRKNYRIRREFHNYQFEGVGLTQLEMRLLSDLGFNVLGAF